MLSSSRVSVQFEIVVANQEIVQHGLPAAIKLGRALPPLFEIYELRVRRPGGSPSSQVWSIVFNQDAFFVDSLGWWQEKREDVPIIL